ncbi:MAG: endonuclease/exonuclease/phosphatase family protein [Nocardioidaceae bacterium]
MKSRHRVALLGALALAVTAGLVTGSVARAGGADRHAVSAGATAPKPFTVIQLNLCLHQRNLGKCFDRPGSGGAMTPRAKRDEAVQVIQDRRPNAVTLNEVCLDDLRAIHRRTGYEWRFTATKRRLAPCSDGRGRFGIALLARGFEGPRVDRWRYGGVTGYGRWGMCARTAGHVLLCTSHLEPGSPMAQCKKLRRELSHRELPVVFGGDVNRKGDRRACRTRSLWVRRNFMADQLPGIQHVYGTAAAFAAAASGAARHMHSTNHGAFIVRMRPRS